jgi:hypothetical protein
MYGRGRGQRVGSPDTWDVQEGSKSRKGGGGRAESSRGGRGGVVRLQGRSPAPREGRRFWGSLTHRTRRTCSKPTHFSEQSSNLTFTLSPPEDTCRVGHTRQQSSNTCTRQRKHHHNHSHHQQQQWYTTTTVVPQLCWPAIHTHTHKPPGPPSYHPRPASPSITHPP